MNVGLTGIHLPAPFVHHLHATRAEGFAFAAAGVEPVVMKAHEPKVVVGRTIGRNLRHLCPQCRVVDGCLRHESARVLPRERVGEVAVERALQHSCRGTGGLEQLLFHPTIGHRERKVVGVAHLGACHIEANDAKARGEEGVVAVLTDAVHGFIGREPGIAIGTQVSHLPIVVEQIDVGIDIDHHEAVGRSVVADVGNGGIGEAIHLVEGADAAVVGVIGIEPLRGQHIEEVAMCLRDFLFLLIGEVVFPNGRLGKKPGVERKKNKEIGELFHRF